MGGLSIQDGDSTHQREEKLPDYVTQYNIVGDITAVHRFISL